MRGMRLMLEMYLNKTFSVYKNSLEDLIFQRKEKSFETRMTILHQQPDDSWITTSSNLIDKTETDKSIKIHKSFNRRLRNT